MRSMPQNRLTAVGRVAASSRPASSRVRANAGGLSGAPAAARAIPIAALTPIAGAPRTCMVRIACATSW